MARRRNSNSKKYIIIAATVVAVLLLGGGAYAYWNNTNDSASTNGQGQVTEDGEPQDESGTETPGDNTSDPSTDNSGSQSPLKSADEDESTEPKSTTATVTITKVWEDSSQNVIVQSKLTGTGWKTCNLTFTQGTRTVKRSAEAIYQREFSTCAGFSLKASEFPAEGSWSAQLTGVMSNGKITKSEIKTVKVYYP